jgi:hypothetical protein
MPGGVVVGGVLPGCLIRRLLCFAIISTLAAPHSNFERSLVNPLIFLVATTNQQPILSTHSHRVIDRFFYHYVSLCNAQVMPDLSLPSNILDLNRFYKLCHCLALSSEGFSIQIEEKQGRLFHTPMSDYS